MPKNVDIRPTSKYRVPNCTLPWQPPQEVAPGPFESTSHSSFQSYPAKCRYPDKGVEAVLQNGLGELRSPSPGGDTAGQGPDNSEQVFLLTP